MCGSAIVDVVAEMLRRKILTRSGKFNVEVIQEKNPKRFRKGEHGWEYIIHSENAPAKFNFELEQGRQQFKSNGDIVFTQDDVREIQKAKGAFLSGIRLLMENRKIQLSDLEQIYIAGAFGTFIHKDNAHFIGLIPDVELDEVLQIGNAAGEGAKSLLLNTN